MIARQNRPFGSADGRLANDVGRDGLRPQASAACVIYVLIILLSVENCAQGLDIAGCFKPVGG